MATERAEGELFRRLYEDTATVGYAAATLPQESTPVRDPVAWGVFGLDREIDRIFFDPKKRPSPPMIVSLRFEGGSIEISRTSITTDTKLSVDGSVSRFSRGNDAYGEVGSATYNAEDLRDRASVAKILDDLKTARPRIVAALFHPPEGATLLYKPTSVSTAGR